jgi:hypothetical protein
LEQSVDRADGARGRRQCDLVVELAGKRLDNSGGVLAPSGIPDWQWRSLVEPHLPRNNAGYEYRDRSPQPRAAGDSQSLERSVPAAFMAVR